MDAVKRTRLDPAQRRAQLIDLGARMLAERPLEQISVEDIADQAGVSRGLLFHYFASKSEFHLAIVRHSSEQMLQRTEPSESVSTRVRVGIGMVCGLPAKLPALSSGMCSYFERRRRMPRARRPLFAVYGG